jgi:CheY-like chemotaxis protein
MLDEPYVIEALKSTLEHWGYDLIGISKADFIQDVIRRNEVDLLILAGEMRVAGPSLEGHFEGRLHERMLALKNTVIDREFGVKVESKLREDGVKIPIIYLSTEDMDGPVLFRDEHGKLKSAIFPKPEGMFKESFKQAVKEFLEREF